MNRKLTARQAIVLRELNGFILEFGHPPTHVELANLIGVSSPKAASDHLVTLEKKGYISIRYGVPRGVKVLKQSDEVAEYKLTFEQIKELVVSVAELGLDEAEAVLYAKTFLGEVVYVMQLATIDGEIA